MATMIAEPATAASRVPRWVHHPVVLALGTAGLLWLSFPPVEWHGTVWVALVPLFLLVAHPERRVSVVLSGWLSGFAFWLLAVQWVLAVDSSAWIGWLAMAFALSLFWLGFMIISRAIIRRFGWPITVVAPLVWVGLEYLRAHVLTGFPWYYLAHSQFRQIYWTQIADLTGSLGLSYLIALVNAGIVEILIRTNSVTQPTASAPIGGTRAGWVRLGLVALGLAATLCYGVFRVHTAHFRAGPRLAMLQSGEIQEYNPQSRKSSAALHQLYLSLVDKAAALRPRPDLIIWPETAYPFNYVVVDPQLNAAEFEAMARRYNPDMIAADWTLKRDRINADLRHILDRTRVPMMLGATTYHFRSPALARYNSAILVQPNAEPQSYHKLHLVPFGEYVPLIEVFPPLIYLTPFEPDRLPTLNFGERPSWFTLGSLRIAAAICFEDTIPHVVRRFFAEVPTDAQPDLIVNLSNDGWFQMTAEHEMHLAVSTFRCIENRVPMARAVNTGVSALIDGNGQILQSLSKQVADQVLDGTAPLDDRTSFYSQWGDWLGQATLAATLIGWVVTWFAPRRRREPGSPLAGNAEPSPPISPET